MQQAKVRRPAKLARGWPTLRCKHCQEEVRAGQWHCQGCLQQVTRCDCPAGQKQPEPSARARRIMRLLERTGADHGEAAAQERGDEQGGGDGDAAGEGRLGEVAAPPTSRPLGTTLAHLAAPGTGTQRPHGGNAAAPAAGTGLGSASSGQASAMAVQSAA